MCREHAHELGEIEGKASSTIKFERTKLTMCREHAQELGKNMQGRLSVIVSVYNEEENLQQFQTTIEKAMVQVASMGWEHEIIFVNDGSSDKSRNLLDSFAENDSHTKVIHFSRNFGHEAAMIAGIDKASGEFMVCMDADLQNPPELLPEMLNKYLNGDDIVLMSRAENKDAGIIKRITSKAFYMILNRLSTVQFEQNVSDFFGLSERVAAVLKQDFRERNRYLRGFIQSIGFRKSIIEYKAPERYAGVSKYSIRSLFRIAMHTLNCFSVTPLKAGALASIVSLTMMVGSFLYYIIFYIRNGFGSGTALLCSFITFLFSILFLLLGTIGEYLGMVMTEIRKRPIYIVMDTKNLNENEEDV